MKKILASAAFYLLITACLFAQEFKFPLKISANKRYLTDQNGQPFFYNADTGWKLFLKLDKDGVLDYLTDRKSKKFTVIQTMLTGFVGEKNIFGDKPFADSSDFSTANKQYFDHVEWVVQQTDSLGLLIAIAPLWAGCCGEGYGGKGAVGPTSIMSANGPEKSRGFGEYIGKRFSKYNNIMWIMGGDIDPFEDRETIHQLALGIKGQAPHQLMTYHASSSHSSTDVWENPSWLDVVMTYTYFRGFNKAWNKNQPDVYEVNFKEYAKTPIKPFFLGESTYEGEHDAWGSAVQARKQAYWSVLSGGAGNAYGTPMWNFPVNWKTFLELPGGNSLQQFFTLFHSRPWYRIVPDSTSKIIVEGQGVYAQNDYAVACSDEEGKFIIAYIPSGRTFKINTGSLKGKAVKASWYNPRDGVWQLVGSYKKPQIIPFKTPDQNDWVLVLDSLQ
jgi:hypothetical protein